MRNEARLSLVWMALAIGLIQKSTADEVLDWNAVFNQAIVKSSYASALSFRQAAIVHVSMFDALNGIERHRQPIHVTEPAPKGASRRAAVIQAAYASMLHLFPDQKELLDGRMEASLAALVEEDDGDGGNSVVRGLAWGQHVADLIWDWRSTDGYDPSPSTYTGSTDVGQWRPTPPAYAPALFPWLPTSLTWVIPSPSSFRPPPPPRVDERSIQRGLQRGQSHRLRFQHCSDR